MNIFDVRRCDLRGQIIIEYNDVILIILLYVCIVCKCKVCILVKIMLLKVSVILDFVFQDKLFY